METSTISMVFFQSDVKKYRRVYDELLIIYHDWSRPRDFSWYELLSGLTMRHLLYCCYHYSYRCWLIIVSIVSAFFFWFPPEGRVRSTLDSSPKLEGHCQACGIGDDHRLREFLENGQTTGSTQDQSSFCTISQTCVFSAWEHQPINHFLNFVLKHLKRKETRTAKGGLKRRPGAPLNISKMGQGFARWPSLPAEMVEGSRVPGRWTWDSGIDHVPQPFDLLEVSSIDGNPLEPPKNS